jgi:hypothetical protein
MAKEIDWSNTPGAKGLEVAKQKARNFVGAGQPIKDPGPIINSWGGVENPAMTTQNASLTDDQKFENAVALAKSRGIAAPVVNTPTAPGVPSVTNQPTAETPSVVKPYQVPKGWAMSGKGGITPQGEIPTIVKKSGSYEEGNRLLEGIGVPEAAPKKDLNTQIEDLVSSIENNRQNRGAYGLAGNAQNRILDIRKAQINASGSGNAERNAIERAKLGLEVRKFDQGNNLKDPMNFLKALEMTSPDILDEAGIKTGKKDYGEGSKTLESMGYPIPKGMKLPEPKKIPVKGDVVKGYRFKGGNLADQKNWEKI